MRLSLLVVLFTTSLFLPSLYAYFSFQTRLKTPQDGRSGIEHLAYDISCPDITRGEIKSLVEVIKRFGGHIVNPYQYDESVEGLQKFLEDSGVGPRFSAAEMVRPHQPDHAKYCGYELLLPPRCRWPSGAVQGILASMLSLEINQGDLYGPENIYVRNWWRPRCYNSRVGGAPASDHLQARGFDLDFSSAKKRATAQNLLCELYKKEAFSLQVGIGCRTLHIGVGSPKVLTNFPADGSRYWVYRSLQSCEIKRLSHDDCWVRNQEGMRFIYPHDLSRNDSTRPQF